jgi:hypothetical protein
MLDFIDWPLRVIKLIGGLLIPKIHVMNFGGRTPGDDN